MQAYTHALYAAVGDADVDPNLEPARCEDPALGLLVVRVKRHLCIDMCMGMCLDMSMDMCMGMHMDMYMDMCVKNCEEFAKAP